MIIILFVRKSSSYPVVPLSTDRHHTLTDELSHLRTVLTYSTSEYNTVNIALEDRAIGT